MLMITVIRVSLTTSATQFPVDCGRVEPFKDNFIPPYLGMHPKRSQAIFHNAVSAPEERGNVYLGITGESSPAGAGAGAVSGRNTLLPSYFRGGDLRGTGFSRENASRSRGRDKRASKLTESRWSTPPMDTRSPRGVTSGLPVSWKGIGYLMKVDRVDGRGKEEWAPGT
ncbi:hypothetical protein EVAR_48309_1 [Eumeta japonica]|uniref:Uncharacterized protein n=1 Tax=Eumeta variegata TaxID=151549 RepID=A0A4C1WJR9_EUMVA|nr:hypothetical protein EVAR_48309_1 [Eumeta japonica]